MPEVLDAILLWDGKCGYPKCISGWFGALRGALRGPLGLQMVDLRCQDTEWVGGNDKEVLDAILLRDGLT